MEGVLVEGHFVEKAIVVLQTIPRSYRLKNGLVELLDELRVRLRESRESSMEMMRIESDPIDLTDAVSYARMQVSGHADRFDALAAFALLTPPMDASSTRENAAKMLKGSISHIFASSTFSSDFRKVAASPGASHRGRRRCRTGDVDGRFVRRKVGRRRGRWTGGC